MIDVTVASVLHRKERILKSYEIENQIVNSDRELTIGIPNPLSEAGSDL